MTPSEISNLKKVKLENFWDEVDSEKVSSEYPKNEIQDFFSGGNVFITGGTGFLGKRKY